MTQINGAGEQMADDPGKYQGDFQNRCASTKQLKPDICPVCGANKQAYREMMHEDCWHGHGE